MMQRYLLMGCLFPMLLAGVVQAQGTKLWTVDRYDMMERGTADGVGIRSDGRLEAGPSKQMVYDTGKSYAWSLAADREGNGYVGLGGTTAGSGIVMRVTPNGNATKLLETKDLAVQAVAVARDGSVIAATSPDGKVYRVPAGGGTATVLFDAATSEEKPKYLWDVAASPNGDVYVAAGAPAVVYKIPTNGGKAQVLFKTADQHIRCLLLAADGTLWAGTDGSGVIYRIDTKVSGAKPFAAYAAPRREITSLAMDEVGNVYAAGVGARGSLPLPPLPVTGNVGITVTFSQPGSTAAAGTNSLISDGSEIYRIAKDGTPARLLTMKEDVVYALTFRKGALLAATGNRGRVYRIDPAVPGQFTDIAHLDAAQGIAFAPAKDGLLVTTSNSGKLFRLSDAPSKESVYTSEVFDAKEYSRWGRVEARTDGVPAGYDLWVRSGNVQSPVMGWSDWVKMSPEGVAAIPEGRFAQWKAVLHGGSGIDSVGLNYLPRNVAPIVDEIVVQPGAKMAAGAATPAATTVQVAFPVTTSANPAAAFQQDANTAPLTAQKDKNSVTARWLAHDDNGDDLTFAIWYRGVGETNWRLLKDQIRDHYYSFDASLLPDGNYELRVVASDAPVHTDSQTLTGERISPAFVVDTTPPVPGTLTASMVSSRAGAAPRIHATLDAHDATSPIAHAEYSVDGGAWQYLEPVGQVSDSQTEHYDFTAEAPQATTPVTDAKEHVIAVRVYDRYDNMAAVKAVVR
jgi:sugar lactone lactonase YvrE